MTRLAELRDQPLDPLEAESAVAHPGAGAIVTFIGRVRNYNGDLSVTHLEYQAYPAMARGELARIVEEIEAKMPGTRLAVVHRTGDLAVGEAAVICSASAAHRTEAFEACRQLIDQVKSRVPIWKREHGPEGPYWVGWQDARCSPGEQHGVAHAREHHDHGVAHAHRSVPGDQPGSKPPLEGLRAICITVSDTRDTTTDESGAVAERLLSDAGAAVRRLLVTDDRQGITDAILNCVADRPEVVLLLGGTGIGPRDVTHEALAPLLERTLDGYGEAFRRLSFDEVGARALLSRASGGTIGRTLVFSTPGSPNATRLALERLIIPLLPHACLMMAGRGHGLGSP